MNTAFFFQIQKIPDSSSIFNQLKNQQIFFSYFQVNKKYYLFLYAQKPIDINFLYQSIDVIQELDTKQRKIRSLRGFFLYALEIIEFEDMSSNGEKYEILSTNLQPFFWRKVKNIIRQNKKAALQEFLFGSTYDRDDSSQGLSPALGHKIQNLQNQVNSLQQKMIELEQNQTLKIKKALSELLKSSEASKIDLPSNEEKGLHGPIFITLAKISEEEKIEIIKTGFQLNQKGKISLKKYYESTQEYSLFQFKGYSIKYESIRRTTLYQKLKLDIFRKNSPFWL